MRVAKGTPLRSTRWCVALPLGSRAQHRQRVRRQSPGLTVHATHPQVQWSVRSLPLSETLGVGLPLLISNP